MFGNRESFFCYNNAVPELSSSSEKIGGIDNKKLPFFKENSAGFVRKLLVSPGKESHH